MTGQPEFMTPAAVAAEWQCSPDSVLRLFHSGQLEGFAHGRLVRIRRSSVQAFTARNAPGDQLTARRRRRSTA